MTQFIIFVAAIVLAAAFIAAFQSDAQEKYKVLVAKELFTDAHEDGASVGFHCQGFRMTLGPCTKRKLIRIVVQGHNDHSYSKLVLKEVHIPLALVIRHPGASCHDFQLYFEPPFFRLNAIGIDQILRHLIFLPNDNLIRKELLDSEPVRQALCEFSSLGTFSIACERDEITFSLDPETTLSDKKSMETFVRASIRFFQGLGKIFAHKSDSWAERGLATSVDWDSPYFVPDADHPARSAQIPAGLAEEGIFELDDLESADRPEADSSLPRLESGSSLAFRRTEEREEDDRWNT